MVAMWRALRAIALGAAADAADPVVGAGGELGTGAAGVGAGALGVATLVGGVGAMSGAAVGAGVGVCAQPAMNAAVHTATKAYVRRHLFGTTNMFPPLTLDVLRRRDKRVIPLMLALKLDEAVIAARAAIRIIATHLWAAFINRTSTIILIKEHAHRFVHVIFAMPQDADSLAFVNNRFSEPIAGFVGRNAVMFSQANDVARFGFNVVVAAAIAGTFRTVVANFLSHGRRTKAFRAMLVKIRV